MDLLLTHAYFLNDDVKEQRIMKPYAPLGILSISAFLEQQGIDHQVYDTTFSTKQEFHQYLLRHRPKHIGIYTNLMTKLNVLELIQFCKANLAQTIITLGGPDVRHNAESYLKSGADFVVLGEGEETMYELALAVKTNASTSGINGIAFLDNHQLHLNPERAQLRDLNQLPMPNRKKINLHQYLDCWKKHHGQSALSISTMRGCPYTCKWCSRAVYGLSYRRRSPENVVEELRAIQEAYRPDLFWFVDDVFTISHRWMEGFRDALQSNGVAIRYECITRADRMNEEVISILKETGCFRVWIGAESGSQRVIDLMDRRVSVQQVRDMIQLANRYGVETGTFIMLGYPGETRADIRETIHHLKTSNPDNFTITITYPIKGTELYAQVEDEMKAPSWSESTDRDIDIPRPHSRKYYDYAMRYVISEVQSEKEKMKRAHLRATTLKAKSMLARLGMWWHAGSSH